MQMITFTRWFFLCLAGFLLFGGCSEDENEPTIQREQLPLDAQTFLARFFPDQISLEIKRMTETDSEETKGYQVTLADEMSVAFDEDGLWLHVAAPNGDFPETFDTFFTEGMKECVRQKYAGDRIVRITRTFFGDVLTLQSNKQLAFQTFQDTFLGEVLPESSLAELPSTIRNFVSTHFPDAPYQWIIKNTSTGKNMNFAYLIWLKGYVKLSFDANSAWNELHSLKDLLPASIVLTLPQEVQDYLANRYPQAKINYISLSDATCYTIQVDSKLQVVIDPAKKPDSVVVSLQKIKEVINRYFPEITIYSVSYPAVYDATWSITVKLPNGVDIKLNKEYGWLGMDGNGYPLPDTVHSLFPEKAGAYLATHTTGEISKVALVNTNYLVVLTDGQGFLFDPQGEFIANEEISLTPYEKTYRYIRYHFPDNFNTAPSFKSGEGWTYILSDQLEVKFDLSGNLIAE